MIKMIEIISDLIVYLQKVKYMCDVVEQNKILNKRYKI